MSVDIGESGSELEGRPEGGSEVGQAPGAKQVVDRAAAFAVVSPAVPRKFVYWLLASAAVLGLGGLAVEHLFSSTGINPVPAAHRHATTTTVTQPAVSPPAGGREQLSASLPAFMDLKDLRATPAPEYTLTDQAGRPYPLPGQPGKTVVLTFFNGSCNDICPVVAAEIRQADTDLGAEAAKVDFVTVNTDPSALAVSSLSGAEAELDGVANWHIVTGPLATMNAIWKSYGITISVVRHTGVEAHNNVIYFIDPQGKERYRSTPFANENRTGVYSLPSENVTRWGSGIASFAGKLATQ
jgi:protein SCO1/2